MIIAAIFFALTGVGLINQQIHYNHCKANDFKPDQECKLDKRLDSFKK